MPKRKANDTPKRGNGDGTITERPSGNYQVQVVVNGRRISETLPSKTAAKRRLAELTTEKERGLLAEPSKVTVAEYAELWLGQQTQLRPKAQRSYREKLGYALERLGPLRVREVTRAQVKETLAALTHKEMKHGRGKGKPMAKSTLDAVRARLRTLFREAVSDRIIHASPMEDVKPVKGAHTPPERVGRVLDFHEAARLRELGEALYEAGLCRLWPALFTAVAVGPRRGEVMGLRLEDVDLKRGVLRVRQARTCDGGKVLTSEPKTEKSNRDIPIPESLKVMLERHHARRRRERAEAGEAWQETGALFASEVGTWSHPDFLNRALAALLKWSDPKLWEKRRRAVNGAPAEKLAALEAVVMRGERLPEVTPHDLRHTFATLALRRRVPVEVVSRMLGHARVSITMDIYRHVLESELRAEAVDLFAEAQQPPSNLTRQPAAVA